MMRRFFLDTQYKIKYKKIYDKHIILKNKK